jgi:hypothetical protein
MLLHPDIAVAMCACYRSQWLRCCWLSVLSVPDYDLTGALHFAVTLFVIFAEKYFTLGDYPVRVSGMKVYQTSDESCILETPVCWGSNAAVRAVVVQAPGGGGCCRLSCAIVAWSYVQGQQGSGQCRESAGCWLPLVLRIVAPLMC